MEPIIDEALARRRVRVEEKKSEDVREDGTLLDHLVGQTQGLCFVLRFFGAILTWNVDDRSPDVEG